LYDKYRDAGLVVLGFPSNDFGDQEPGSEEKIQEFCRLTYGVKFPMFAKTMVRADNADPLYRALGTLAAEYPQWNFHKYLLDRNGRLVASFPSKVAPQDPKLVSAIEKLL
jgi:glutathione peroxidase